MEGSISPERQLLHQRVQADPDGYEREAVARVTTAVRGILKGNAGLEDVRLNGKRPHSRIEVIFRPQSRPNCLIGFYWEIWESEHSPFSFEDIEIEVTTPLREWLDTQAPYVLSDLDCEEDDVVWINEVPRQR